MLPKDFNEVENAMREREELEHCTNPHGSAQVQRLCEDWSDRAVLHLWMRADSVVKRRNPEESA